MEFGEKLKKAREEKGITQQTLADQLFVTRQAVSRWECGTRFPDLLTAKKIAELLEVSLDELLSGEENVKFIEENPIVTSPAVSAIQAGLYGFAGMAFLVTSITALPFLDESYQYIREYLPTMIDLIRRFLMTALMALGFLLAVKGKLTPKKTALFPILYYLFEIGWTLAVHYSQSFYFLWTPMLITTLIISDLPDLLIIWCIIEFFIKGKNRYRFGIYSLGILTALENVRIYFVTMDFISFEDFNFPNSTITTLGRLAFVGLMLYQTYALHKKRCQAANTGCLLYESC